MNNIVDGKLIKQEIQEKLKAELERLNQEPQIDILWVGNSKASEAFIKIKSNFGKNLGVKVNLKHFNEHISESELIDAINRSAASGLIVQLPLPEHIDAKKVINNIPLSKDIDTLNEKSFQNYKDAKLEELDFALEPPVAFAVRQILNRYNVDLKNKTVVILGYGRLVGQPVFELFKKFGVNPLVFDRESDKNKLKNALKNADVIVSGTGQEKLVRKEDIKDGVVLIDAGTSSSKSQNALVGDIDWDCAQKASLFARSPGGVGPITVAGIYSNLLKLITQH